MPTQPEPGEDVLTVVNEATGVTYGKILSYRINTQYTTPTDSWDFTVFSEDNPRKLRHTWRPLQPIKLLIAGNQQVVGRIDGTRGTGESGAALQVHGRDYLADIVDSTVDPQFQIKKSQDIGAFLLELFKPWGITTIFGNFNLTRNVASGRKPFNEEPGQALQVSEARRHEGVGESGRLRVRESPSWPGRAS
jgi:prophage tail gpP-like protein